MRAGLLRSRVSDRVRRPGTAYVSSGGSHVRHDRRADLTGRCIGGRGSPSRARSRVRVCRHQVACECDYMWTGPTCSHPCPYPYGRAHGICVVKDPGIPTTDRGPELCEDGWTGSSRPGSSPARRAAVAAARACFDWSPRVGTRQLPLRLRVHMAGAPGGDFRRGREGTHQPVSGAAVRTVLPGEVPHVRGEASVQHERRAVQRDVRPERRERFRR